MAKKKSKVQAQPNEAAATEEEDFDEVLKEFVSQDPGKSLPIGRQIFYFVLALFVSSVPLNLYLSPMFDLSVNEHSTYFIITTLTSSVFLMKAYSDTASTTEAKLLKERTLQSSRGKKNKSSGEGDSELRARTARETIAYALFINNFFYYVIFLTNAFALMPWIEQNFIGMEESGESLESFKIVNYATSVAGPALLLVSLT